MLSFVGIGDPHIGAGLQLGKTTGGSTLNSRLKDQLDLLDWSLERALENHSQYIVIFGDIFEEPKPQPYIVNLFFSWLKKCQVNDISVHIILGNHCILRNGLNSSSVLDIITEMDLDKVSVYKDISTIYIDTTAITFIPFKDRKSLLASSNAEGIDIIRQSLLYELSSIPKTYTKVIIGHLAIEGSIPVGDEIDDLTNELFCPLSMFEGYDYVWMGHIHKPQVMQKEKPYVAHIGSMDISNFGETDHKKHIVVFDCSSSSINNGRWHYEKLPTRSLQKVSISIPKDIIDTTEYVLDQLKNTDIKDKSIVKVEVSLTSSELLSVNKKLIEEYLVSQGVSFVNGISESKKVRLIKKDNSSSIDQKMDVVSAIKTYANACVDKDLQSKYIELSLELLTISKLDSKD